jgi:hypothetical protein
MSWLSSLWSGDKARPESQAGVSTTQTLTDILRTHELVEVVPNNGDPFVVVAPIGSSYPTSNEGVQDRQFAYHNGLPILAEPAGPVMLSDPATMAMIGELGSSSASPFTSHLRAEYNRELAGINGLRKYDMMRRGDGTVRGTLRMMKTPVLGARWFIEPASDSVRDRNAAEFVWKCLTEYMSISFPQFLTEALLCVDFGYYMFEKVWKEQMIDGQRRLVWQKLAPRHPMDVKKWKFDRGGGPDGVWMYMPQNAQDSEGGTAPAGTWIPGFEGAVQQDSVYIPIDKLLVFTFDREAGNIEGMSVLRSAYKHHYYKDQLYKIDAIQKERHGIGIPVIKLPVGFTPADKAAADQLGRNLRTNERAHVTLPPNWDLIFAKLEGQPVKALESIEHHDARIRENILAAFTGDAKQTKEEDLTLFLKAMRFLADIVCETINLHAIPQLMEYNFSRVGTPRLVARRIGEQDDWRTMTFAVRNLVGAKVLTPDPALEDYLRKEMDLPQVDKQGRQEMFEETLANQAKQQEVMGALSNTLQDSPTKQAGPDKPGMPRQTPPGGQKVPAPNAGTDRSGGK